MKPGIHPEYVECTVRCSCGNTFKTRSTKSELVVDLCNECHPFYTGQQKLVDAGGRVQRFSDKFGSAAARVAEAEAKKKAERQAAAEEAQKKAAEERRRIQMERKLNRLPRRLPRLRQRSLPRRHPRPRLLQKRLLPRSRPLSDALMAIR